MDAASGQQGTKASSHKRSVPTYEQVKLERFWNYNGTLHAAIALPRHAVVAQRQMLVALGPAPGSLQTVRY